MTTKKWIPITIFALLLCLIAFRETGIVGVNLYKSKLSSSHSITKSMVNPGGQEQFSYHVILRHDDTILEDYTHSYNNQPPVKIEAVLDKPAIPATPLCRFSRTLR